MSPVSFISPVRLPFPSLLHCSANTAKTATSRRRLVTRSQLSESPEPSGGAEGGDDVPPSISNNWREFRASLVAGSTEQHEQAKEMAYRAGHWAHDLSLPEKGCFLASHPAYYRRRLPYLTQSVVFLTEYDLEGGATGLVLNRPLNGTAEELEAVGLFGRSVNISATRFAKDPVYMGGPNSFTKGVITVVHSDPTIGGEQPLEGVFMCDVADYLSQINDDYDCSNVRLFSGCLRWAPGTLESEVDEGSWYCVAASELFALKHCIQLPKPLWIEIMQSQGGTFAKIADRITERQEGSAEDESGSKQ